MNTLNALHNKNIDIKGKLACVMFVLKLRDVVKLQTVACFSFN